MPGSMAQQDDEGPSDCNLDQSLPQHFVPQWTCASSGHVQALHRTCAGQSERHHYFYAICNVYIANARLSTSRPSRSESLRAQMERHLNTGCTCTRQSFSTYSFDVSMSQRAVPCIGSFFDRCSQQLLATVGPQDGSISMTGLFQPFISSYFDIPL